MTTARYDVLAKPESGQGPAELKGLSDKKREEATQQIRERLQSLLADRFQLSGGTIHNIGLAAAHLAADTPSGRITVGHLARATQRELQKSGRTADVAALGQIVGPLVETPS